jgi:hypothetical protein
MKIRSFFIIIAIIFIIPLDRPIFAQEIYLDTINNKLILNGEMGYITKEVALPFLLNTKLIRKTSGYGEWKKLNSEDTVGKFYKMDSCNHYLVCLPKLLDQFKSLYWFVELDSTGQILKKEIFDLGTLKWDHYYKEFTKFGELFSCTIHHGSFTYYSIDNVYFTHLAPLDSLDKIRVLEWINYRKLIRSSKNSNTIEYYVYEWELEKMSDSTSHILTCYYYLQRGYYVSKTKFRKGGFKLYPFKRKIKVRYTIKDNHIETEDQDKLKKIKRFVKIPLTKTIM